MVMAVFLKAKDGIFSRINSFVSRGEGSVISRLKTVFSEKIVNDASVVEAASSSEANQLLPEMGSDSELVPVAQRGQVVDMTKWKRINASLLDIRHHSIPYSPWTVLKILRSEGFEAYLVGGCVRDLVLHKPPKDFDIITTAQLDKIKKTFHRSIIIGRRFPICKVFIKGSAVEVSSFETTTKDAEERDKDFLSQMPHNCDKKDFVRWRNSMHRDFTVNSLFFDPFKNLIYDYTNGLADLKSLKLRTLIPALTSFQEDNARILRGIRIAGRLGLKFSKDTETAMHKLSSSLESLDKFRILLELNYMLSYGAAEPTICLLQRFNLLEMFLPFHAAYLHQQANVGSSQSSMMLIKLFFSMDKLVSCHQPCDCILWVGLLAFHQALVINPQDSLATRTFASVLYQGSWKEGVKYARQNAKVQVNFAPELSGYKSKSDEELAKEVTQLACLVQESIYALVNRDSLFKFMSKYPSSPCSGLVFVPYRIGNNVSELFEVLVHDVKSYENSRKMDEIDYFLLGKGDIDETRFVLGKIILEALGAEPVQEGAEVNKANIIEDLRIAKCPEKHNAVDKMDVKAILSTLHLEPKQEISKKQKFEEVAKKRIATQKEEMDQKHVMSALHLEPNQEIPTEQKFEEVSEEIAMKKEGAAVKRKHKEGVKKHQKVIDVNQSQRNLKNFEELAPLAPHDVEQKQEIAKEQKSVKANRSSKKETSTKKEDEALIGKFKEMVENKQVIDKCHNLVGKKGKKNKQSPLLLKPKQEIGEEQKSVKANRSSKKGTSTKKENEALTGKFKEMVENNQKGIDNVVGKKGKKGKQSPLLVEPKQEIAKEQKTLKGNRSRHSSKKETCTKKEDEALTGKFKEMVENNQKVIDRCHNLVDKKGKKRKESPLLLEATQQITKKRKFRKVNSSSEKEIDTKMKKDEGEDRRRKKSPQNDSLEVVVKEKTERSKEASNKKTSCQGALQLSSLFR